MQEVVPERVSWGSVRVVARPEMGQVVVQGVMVGGTMPGLPLGEGVTVSRQRVESARLYSCVAAHVGLAREQWWLEPVVGEVGVGQRFRAR